MVPQHHSCGAHRCCCQQSMWRPHYRRTVLGRDSSGCMPGIATVERGSCWCAHGKRPPVWAPITHACSCWSRPPGSSRTAAPNVATTWFCIGHRTAFSAWRCVDRYSYCIDIHHWCIRYRNLWQGYPSELVLCTSLFPAGCVIANRARMYASSFQHRVGKILIELTRSCQ